MAKAILKFDLNDPDDRMAHLRCVKSTDMALVLWEIVYNKKKSASRYFEGLENEAEKAAPYYDVLDYVWSEILAELEDHDVFVDKLID